MFSGFYSSNLANDRRLMWDELFGLHCWWEVPWCLGRDFNVVRFSSEKVGLTVFTPSMVGFSKFIDSLDLVDLPLVGGEFT